MPYQVRITIRNAGPNLKRISEAIAQLVENATGVKVTTFMHNRNQSNMKREQELKAINGKLFR